MNSPPDTNLAEPPEASGDAPVQLPTGDLSRHALTHLDSVLVRALRAMDALTGENLAKDGVSLARLLGSLIQVRREVLAGGMPEDKPPEAAKEGQPLLLRESTGQWNARHESYEHQPQ